jgi:serine/threonine protein kinase
MMDSSIAINRGPYTRPSLRNDTIAEKGIAQIDDLVGEVVGQRYEILNKLREGGMGTVFRAWDGETQTFVAVKVLARGEDEKDQLNRQSHFSREQKILTSISGKGHVLQMLASGISHGHEYIVTEYLPGMALDQILAQEKNLSLGKTLDVMEAGSEALKEVHGTVGPTGRPLVHGDYKPSNVMGSKLIDFGIAQEAHDGSGVEKGKITGTPPFMAPEMMEHFEISPATDHWALFVTGHRALTGEHLPFVPGFEKIGLIDYPAVPVAVGTNLSGLRPFENWFFSTGLALDPAKRFKDGDEIAEHLGALRYYHQSLESAFKDKIDNGVTAARAGQSPTAGTIIYFCSEKNIRVAFLEAVRNQFTAKDGFEVLNSNDGVYVYSPYDKDATIARSRNLINNAAQSEIFIGDVITQEVDWHDGSSTEEITDRNLGEINRQGLAAREQRAAKAADSDQIAHEPIAFDKSLAEDSADATRNAKGLVKQKSSQAQATFEQARDQALARIERLPVSDAEKAEMRGIARASWDDELARVKNNIEAKAAFEAGLKADYDRARWLQRDIREARAALKSAEPEAKAELEQTIREKSAELEAIRKPLGMKINGFVRQHGPMMAVIIALDIAMNYEEIKKEGAGKVIKAGMEAVDGYFSFLAGQKALEKTIGLTAKISGAGITRMLGTGMAVGQAIAEHQDHLQSSNNATSAYAAMAVAVQGLIGYISTQAGLAAAEATTPLNPWVGPIAGLGTTLLTYLSIETVGKNLGTDKWIGRKWARGEIIDAFRDLGKKRDRSGVLAVNHTDTEIPYFNQLVRTVEVNGQKVGLTRAQEFLATLQAARNYDKLSPNMKHFMLADPVGRQAAKTLANLGSLDRLEVDNYDALDDELLAGVAETVRRYRAKHHIPEDTDSSRSRFEVYCTNRRSVDIPDPLTGEVIGSRTFVDIKVYGEKQHWGMTANGNGWVNEEETVDSYAVSGSIKTEGDSKNIAAAEIILASASEENPGTYDISLQELAALDLTIPAEKLAIFPVVRRDLQKQLALHGYKVKGDLARTYFRYALHSIDLTQLDPKGISLNLSARGAATQGQADPFQINIETSVLRRLVDELLVK